MTAVKICGLTRRSDVEAAVESGADFVGFVLWPKSPRAVTIEQVREIVRTVPASVTPVGVFVGVGHRCALRRRWRNDPDTSFVERALSQ